MKNFFQYTFIGCANTLLHWLCFGGLFAASHSQALSNLGAFCIAASFSYIANAKLTFKIALSVGNYLLFIAGMAVISFAAGLAGDFFGIYPLFTLIIFSALSLVLGFLFAQYIVFKGKPA